MKIKETFIVAEPPRCWVGGQGGPLPIRSYDIHKVHLLSDNETYVIERGPKLDTITRKEFMELQNNFIEYLKEKNK